MFYSAPNTQAATPKFQNRQRTNTSSLDKKRENLATTTSSLLQREISPTPMKQTEATKDTTERREDQDQADLKTTVPVSPEEPVSGEPSHEPFDPDKLVEKLLELVQEHPTDEPAESTAEAAESTEETNVEGTGQSLKDAFKKLYEAFFEINEETGYDLQ